MGSSSSKDGASGTGGVTRTSRARSMVGSRVFHSSCLGCPSPNNVDADADADADADLLDHPNKETHPFPQVEEEEDELDEDEDDDNDNDTHKTTSSQQHLSSTPPTTLRSRFSFIPPNFSFTRPASFGSSSSSSYSLFSTTPNTQPPPPPALHTSSSPNSLPISSPGSIPHTSSALSPHLTNHYSNQDQHLHISTNHTHSGRPTTQLGPRQPVERSVRFSRTLSVGRLRDRVLRRSSFTDGLFGRLQQHTQAGSIQENTRRGWAEMTTTLDPHANADVSPSTSTHQLPLMYNSIYNSQHDELETSRPREARYHDIMEHRTDFLERRRRIRSQVRALQRLGSRFENLSGHERSCILAGQHRSGHCTCRMSSRTRNPDDDTSARASISRIVMLAEALFEVLDEIHQQSVVLSSRASVSSLGSIPAPKEVVESMPVKIYTKLQKHQLEEVAQCYICLVEYEEGDCVRILPCHHEFHKTCIDKWLKEIHRVCPLCRGDVCKSESLSSEN